MVRWSLSACVRLCVCGEKMFVCVCRGGLTDTVCVCVWGGGGCPLRNVWGDWLRKDYRVNFCICIIFITLCVSSFKSEFYV